MMVMLAFFWDENLFHDNTNKKAILLQELDNFEKTKRNILENPGSSVRIDLKSGK
jgi:hypothetical protein